MKKSEAKRGKLERLTWTSFVSYHTCPPGQHNGIVITIAAHNSSILTCIIKKLTQCCTNTLTVCLARGFRTKICGRTGMGTWGTNFNNSFIWLDD